MYITYLEPSDAGWLRMEPFNMKVDLFRCAARVEKGDEKNELCHHKIQISCKNSASRCEESSSIVLPQEVYNRSKSCWTEQSKADLWQRSSPSSSLSCGWGLWTQGCTSQQRGVAKPESADCYCSFAKLHLASKERQSLKLICVGEEGVL